MYKEYYYFVSGLPAINFEDTKLLLTPIKFLHTAKDNLTAHDYKLLKLLLVPNNITNLISILYGKETWQDESTIDMDLWLELIDYLKELGDAKPIPKNLSKFDVPLFIIDYLYNYFRNAEPITESIMYKQLFTLLYDSVANCDDKFVRDWFKFDSDVRNITIALNCRRHKIDFVEQLIGNNDMTERLLKSGAADFGLGKDQPCYESLVRLNETSDIIEKEKGLDMLRWKWIDNETFFDYFTLPRLLGYFIKLRIVYRWVHLSQSVGEKRFKEVLHNLETSFEFPEEFAL